MRVVAMIFVGVLFAYVVEGTFLAQLPFSLVGLLYLPVLFLPRRRLRLSCFVLLVLFECLFSRLPILAGLALIVTIETVVEILTDEVNLFSPIAATVALPLIEIARQFWIAIFASLYEIPPPPALSVATLFYSGLLGALFFFLIQRMNLKFESRKDPVLQ